MATGSYYTPEDALREYNRRVPFRKREDELKAREAAENNRKKEEEERRKKEEREHAYEQACNERRGKLVRDDPAGTIFRAICDAIENDENINRKILTHIANTGEKDVILVDSGWNQGLSSSFDFHLHELMKGWMSDDIISQFDDNISKYNHTLTKGSFKDWQISASTFWKFIIVFIVPGLDRKLNITLHKPRRWWSLF